ncbi:MgtC/SapB family protein [Paracoccaceae bacterium Fryx2]|nr:MgtC/SapB family protein [Paracoccaceae bacterium Fryx2]
MNELILRFGVALAIGLLVGLERGWRERDEPDGSRTAGIRTYGITGLLGGVFAAVAMQMDAPYVFAIGFVGFAAVFGWFQAHEAEHDASFSVTAAVSGLCVFALGGLAVAGDFRAAAAGGAALAGLLASRNALHELLKRLTWPELRSALILAVMTAIVLPLLPNRTIDPWNGLNPWEIWFFTVLTAAISFLGYVAFRFLGPTRGFLVGALTGALVSSTAVTIAFAHTARSGGNARALSGGAALAAMISVLRVTVVVALLAPSVFIFIAPEALAAGATFGLCGLALLSRGGSEAEGTLPPNPFSLGPLLLFALLLAVVSTASAAVTSRFGDLGAVASSGLAGTFDVDVAVLSAIRQLGQAVPPETVGTAVLAGLLANAGGRLSMAIVAGPPRYWWPLIGATALAAGAGLLAHAVVPF